MIRARAQSFFCPCLSPLPFRFPPFLAPTLHSYSCHHYRKSCKPAPLSTEILISQGKIYPLLQLPTKSSGHGNWLKKTRLFHKSGVNEVCFRGCLSPFCSLKLSLKTAPLCSSCMILPSCKGWCSWQSGACCAEYTAVESCLHFPQPGLSFGCLSTRLLIFIKSVEMQLPLRGVSCILCRHSVQMWVCSLPQQWRPAFYLCSCFCLIPGLV